MIPADGEEYGHGDGDGYGYGYGYGCDDGVGYGDGYRGADGVAYGPGYGDDRDGNGYVDGDDIIREGDVVA